MRSPHWILLVFLFWACDSAAPESRTCVVTGIEGANLRLLATYHDGHRLHDVMADVPVKNGKACVTLRPPRDEARPTSIWSISIGPLYLGVDDPTPRYAAWPLDWAVYDDLNRNATLDPEELRGRHSLQSYEGPVWFIDYRAALGAYLRADPFANETIAIRPFVSADLAPQHPDDGAYGFDPLPSEFEVAGAVDECDATLYPGCMPIQMETDREEADWVDPRLDDAQVEALGLHETIPATGLPAGDLQRCAVNDDGVLTAWYVARGKAPNRETCECVATRHDTWVHTLADDPLPGIDCAPDADQ